ncbi:hypothetical protein V6N11_053556 [Hibiscus sabdariffa]|uniref:RNase H type-1 domain-containing protein n=1 Tax=Hibiscus sabdariffa TaxID=183260 RepID=A0ABR2SKH1_9ROSI
MDRLGHSITDAVNSGDWTPFRFARNGTALSHLFFADDLVLYAKADTEQARRIANILNLFGASSGHRVSSRKSQILFSSNTPSHIQQEIGDILGFQRVENFGRYLGVPVLSNRLRCSDFDFILDNLRKKLNGWSSRSLSMAGRITLAKAVLSAIPVYYMQTMMFPKRVCHAIEGIIRRFIWGSTLAAPKVSLVNWESICQPIQRGGLGFRNVYSQNQAFIQKLGFLFISNPQALWVRCLREKYRIHDAMPSSIAQNSCSSLWRALSKVWEALLSNVAWSLGNGHSVNFLTDIWVPALGPLRDYARDSLDATNHVSFDSVLTANGDWDVAKLAQIFTEDALPYIIGVKPPSPQGGSDRCIWRWTNHHGFELKSAYDRCAPLILEETDPIWNQIWKLQIQTDCKRVLELLHDTNVDSCPISLVRSIHQFWRRAWYVDLIWVPRSSNQAADSMARIANCSSFDLLFFSDPPAQLHDVLTTDALVLSL